MQTRFERCCIGRLFYTRVLPGKDAYPGKREPVVKVVIGTKTYDLQSPTAQQRAREAHEAWERGDAESQKRLTQRAAEAERKYRTRRTRG